MVSSWAQTQTSAVIIIRLRRCSASCLFSPFQYSEICYLVAFGARWLNLSITFYIFIFFLLFFCFCICPSIPVLCNRLAKYKHKNLTPCAAFFLIFVMHRGNFCFVFFFNHKFNNMHCFRLQTPSVHKNILLFSIEWKQNWLSPHPLQRAWTLYSWTV